MSDLPLCERCQHRSDSRARVQEFIKIQISHGESPPFAGMVCDPAPKHECKVHEGYGRPVESRAECRDFEAMS